MNVSAWNFLSLRFTTTDLWLEFPSIERVRLGVKLGIKEVKLGAKLGAKLKGNKLIINQIRLRVKENK
jgi:hypothetical protein